MLGVALTLLAIVASRRVPALVLASDLALALEQTVAPATVAKLCSHGVVLLPAVLHLR